MDTILYRDKSEIRKLHGIIISDADGFLKILMPDGNTIELNRNIILKVRREGNHGNSE